jgi:hypothetical protein
MQASALRSWHLAASTIVRLYLLSCRLLQAVLAVCGTDGAARNGWWCVMKAYKRIRNSNQSTTNCSERFYLHEKARISRKIIQAGLWLDLLKQETCFDLSLRRWCHICTICLTRKLNIYTPSRNTKLTSDNQIRDALLKMCLCNGRPILQRWAVKAGPAVRIVQLWSSFKQDTLMWEARYDILPMPFILTQGLSHLHSDVT